MRISVNIDPDLLAAAKAACGANTEDEVVRLGLETLVRHAAYRRLRTLLSSEQAVQAPRRRRGNKR